MLLLVHIDLADADIALFEAYEAAVQPLMARHGGRVEFNVRALDGRSETHLVYFPDADAAAAYRSEPARQAAQTLWERCGARSEVVPVRRLD